MSVGQATIQPSGETWKLRDYPYRDENNDLICPLEDGTDLVCKNAYCTSLRFEGLEEVSGEQVTIVGNNKVWAKEN